jgi:hypothetical protein
MNPSRIEGRAIKTPTRGSFKREMNRIVKRSGVSLRARETATNGILFFYGAFARNIICRIVRRDRKCYF